MKAIRALRPKKTKENLPIFRERHGMTMMKKIISGKILSAAALLLCALTVLSACGTTPAQTTAAVTTAEPQPAAPEEAVIAEKGKTPEFTLVYSQFGKKDELAESFEQLYTEKLGVTFTAKSDGDAAGGNEIVFNSENRADCKELKDSVNGGCYAIKAVRNDTGVTILLAYKGDLAKDALLARLAEMIDETSGKASISPEINESKAVVSIGLNENKDKGVIDMYLIGGQSNAAGCSAKGTLSGVFRNVWFAGETEKNRKTGVGTLTLIKKYRKFVKAGLGITDSFIGPEYGMAEVLNDYYDSENPAFIFKSAGGGTALNNDSWGLSDTFGNWYPRSKWNGKEVDPQNSPMGVQYYNFVENFRTVYNKLVSEGYTPKVRGMVWMQGEADLGRETSYKVLLKALINDLRADIAEITGDDSNLEMPFVIGKIATTFETYNNQYVPAFNKVQQAVADSMTNVYTIETSDLIIVNERGKIVGTDKYHFSTKDSETLGKRFAEKLLEHYTIKETTAAEG